MEVILAEITYEFHEKLSNKIWHDNAVKENIKKKLIDLVYFWMEESKIPSDLIEDIVLTGSYAGYNYTPYSDIDVHIILDKSKLGCDKLIDDFLFDKKKLFAEKHKISINETPVEIYPQDMHEKIPANEAVYSLLHNKWLIEPSKQKIDITNPRLLKKSRFYKRLIKKLIREGNIKKIMDVKAKIRRMRQAGLNKEGEFSVENIVYKDLRNRNLLDELDEKLNKLIDRRYSI